MTPSQEFKKYVLQQLEAIGPVKAGRFFGGVGLSRNSIQFGMMMGDSLYFAVDDNTRKKYENAGMRPFSYMKKSGLIVVRKYFEVPKEILANPEQLQHWANDAIQVTNQSKST